MSFNNDDLFKAISDAAEMSLDAVEKAMNCLINSSSHIQFQEQINNLAAVQQHSINSTLKKAVPSLNNALNQAGCAMENSLKQITIEILSNFDISKFNNCMQDIYENVPEDTSINFNETELNIAKNVQSCIKAYNTNPNTITKIKIPVNKEIIGSIFLFIIILIILNYLGYDIAEHFYSLVDGFLVNIGYNELTKKGSK